MADLLLQPGGCGTDLARTFSRPCAAFVRHAWQPYVQHPHSTCWRVVLPALGIGDLLSCSKDFGATGLAVARHCYLWAHGNQRRDNVDVSPTTIHVASNLIADTSS